jgi:hypothetical protein
MSINQRELLQSQTNVEGVPSIKSGEHFETYKLPTTPFTIITQENQTYLLLGKYLVTPKIFIDKAEAIDWLEDNMWEVVLSVACIAITSVNETLKKEEVTNKEES